MKEEPQIAERVIDFLEEHPGEIFSAAELKEILQVAFRVLTSKLRNLIKHNEIGSERISCKVARKLYNNSNIKRGMNLYFFD